MSSSSLGQGQGRGRRNRPPGWWDSSRNKKNRFFVPFNVDYDEFNQLASTYRLKMWSLNVSCIPHVHQNNSSLSLRPHPNIHEITRPRSANEPMNENDGWNPIHNLPKCDNNAWGIIHKVPRHICSSRSDMYASCSPSGRPALDLHSKTIPSPTATSRVHEYNVTPLIVIFVGPHTPSTSSANTYSKKYLNHDVTLKSVLDPTTPTLEETKDRQQLDGMKPHFSMEQILRGSKNNSSPFACKF